MTSVHSSRDEVYRSLENLDKASNATTGELAHIINEAFLSPMRSFSPLPEDILNRTNINLCRTSFYIHCYNSISPNEIIEVESHKG